LTIFSCKNFVKLFQILTKLYVFQVNKSVYKKGLCFEVRGLWHFPKVPYGKSGPEYSVI